MAAIKLRPWGARSLPREGQRVRLTMLRDLELWQGSRRICYTEGEVYTGYVAAISDEGLLDLITDDGRQLRIYARDEALTIELITPKSL